MQKSASSRPALLFDLDGTLVDSVYQHVLAWREALETEGFHLSVWRIHRRSGMSGGRLVKALVRELVHSLNATSAERVAKADGGGFVQVKDQDRPLAGGGQRVTT